MNLSDCKFAYSTLQCNDVCYPSKENQGNVIEVHHFLDEGELISVDESRKEIEDRKVEGNWTFNMKILRE